MSKVTPIPTNLVDFVARFPGLTASGISQLMGKRPDWASGGLAYLVKQKRLVRRSQKGMTHNPAWRYYPSGHWDCVCPACAQKDLLLIDSRAEIDRLKAANQEMANILSE